ncbi:MAG: ParA family protein [Gammaproteobacteria bacterium]
MAHILAIANQKGGVGKTTTSINLAAALIQAQRRVLLVDFDPQGNATMGSGIDKQTLDTTINEVLLGEASTAQALILKTPAGYALLPANSELTTAEVALLDSPHRERTLDQHLQPLMDDYDFILIDCPPSLNMLTLNGLVAAKHVLIPMQCEYFALEGLSSLLNTINQIQQSANPTLEILGILRTMYDPRNKLALEVSEQLQNHFGELVFTNIIPRNVRLAEAPSHGLPVMQYDKLSRGSIAYLNLGGEVLRRYSTYI